jgi:hypothetical protein
MNGILLGSPGYTYLVAFGLQGSGKSEIGCVSLPLCSFISSHFFPQDTDLPPSCVSVESSARALCLHRFFPLGPD